MHFLTLHEMLHRIERRLSETRWATEYVDGLTQRVCITSAGRVGRLSNPARLDGASGWVSVQRGTPSVKRSMRHTPCRQNPRNGRARALACRSTYLLTRFPLYFSPPSMPVQLTLWVKGNGNDNTRSQGLWWAIRSNPRKVRRLAFLAHDPNLPRASCNERYFVDRLKNRYVDRPERMHLL